MIVQPDFLSHWKTQLLVETLEDPCAPIYVIHLWGHCQNRKTDRFQRVNPSILKAICKAAKHDATAFENAMVLCGFVLIENDTIIAHDWSVINASLIAAWKNGRKGGRPKTKNLNKTHGLTQTKPMANPNVTDKRREEKMGLDGEDGDSVFFAAAALLDCKKPTIENAVSAIRLSNDSFDKVGELFITSELSKQPDRSLWYEAISGMAAKFAGVKMDHPAQSLKNWLAGKQCASSNIKTSNSKNAEDYRL